MRSGRSSRTGPRSRKAQTAAPQMPPRQQRWQGLCIIQAEDISESMRQCGVWIVSIVLIISKIIQMVDALVTRGHNNASMNEL